MSIFRALSIYNEDFGYSRFGIDFPIVWISGTCSIRPAHTVLSPSAVYVLATQ